MRFGSYVFYGSVHNSVHSAATLKKTNALWSNRSVTKFLFRTLSDWFNEQLMLYPVVYSAPRDLRRWQSPQLHPEFVREWAEGSWKTLSRFSVCRANMVTWSKWGTRAVTQRIWCRSDYSTAVEASCCYSSKQRLDTYMEAAFVERPC